MLRFGVFFEGGGTMFNFSVYLFDKLVFGAQENQIYEWRFHFLVYLEGSGSVTNGANPLIFIAGGIPLSYMELHFKWM